NPVAFLETIKNVLAVLLIVVIFFTTDVIKSTANYRTAILQLFSVGAILFLCELLYGFSPYFDDVFYLKYFSAVIIFWFLSFVFTEYQNLCYNSIFIFSLASAGIALLYALGFLDNQFEFRGDRLYIFDENPNSIST